jgi:hypothetical protein
VKRRSTGVTSIYEDDVNHISKPDPRIKAIRVINDPGTGMRVKLEVNPGKRPPREPGETPFDRLRR